MACFFIDSVPINFTEHKIFCVTCDYSQLINNRRCKQNKTRSGEIELVASLSTNWEKLLCTCIKLVVFLLKGSSSKGLL